MTRVEVVTEWIVWPEGCPPDDVDADLFAVRVVWCGGLLYDIRNRSRYLTKDGSWSYDREDSYRGTYSDAVARAREVVDTLTMFGGRTWSKLKEKRLYD